MLQQWLNEKTNTGNEIATTVYTIWSRRKGEKGKRKKTHLIKRFV